MKKIINYYDFVNFAEKSSNKTLAFKWCNARISVDLDGIIFLRHTTQKCLCIIENRVGYTN